MTEATATTEGAATGRAARFAVASVAGGASIALGDHLFHVRTDVLVHHWHPQWDGQALVVWPIFMAAAATMLATASIVVGLVPGPAGDARPAPSVSRVGIALLVFYAAYGLTGRLGTDHPWWCLTILTATFVARLVPDPERRRVVAVGLLIGLGGCAGEAAIAALGLFDYVHQDVGGVPLWLFPLYLHGAFAVVALARLVDGGASRGPAGERRP